MRTVGEFKKLVQEHASDILAKGLRGFSDFLKGSKKGVQGEPWGPKMYREECLPLYAVLKYLVVPDDVAIELGNETQTWDARLGDGRVIEVTKAFPGGQAGAIYDQQLRAGKASAGQHWERSKDHLLFPDAIKQALEAKQAKAYGDGRILVVAFDGDYSFEEDSVVQGWVETLSAQCGKGDFSQVLLAEVGRNKAFRLF